MNAKKRAWIQLFCLVSALLVMGCSWNKKEEDLNPGNPVRVQIPFYSQDHYEMSVVELTTLQNVTALKGSAAQLLIDPAPAKSRLVGRAPEIRYFRDRDGVIIAKDSLSLQLLSIYSHFEKLKILDEKVGAASLLKYPLTVAINVHVLGADYERENNASYDSGYDAFLIVPYTKSQLPLMVNAGVLAHEHFHALFFKSVIEPLKDKYPQPKKATAHDSQRMRALMGLPAVESLTKSVAALSGPTSDGQTGDESGSAGDVTTYRRDRYHATLLRGINEGLADFWGWIYSGDTGFVGRSLPQEKISRELDFPPDHLFEKDVLLNAIDANRSDDTLLNLAYTHGTQLARTLRNFAAVYAREKNLSAEEAQVKVGQILISTLPEIQKKFGSLKTDELFSLSQVVGLFALQVKDLSSKSCLSLSNYMPEEGQTETGLGVHCEELRKQETSQPKTPGQNKP